MYLQLRQQQRGLGGFLEDLGTWITTGKRVITQGAPYLEPVKNVLEDPALPQVANIVTQLRQVEATRTRSPTTGVSEPGIGLRHAVPPLKLYLTYRRHPWLVPAALAGAIGVVFFLGRSTR